MADATELFEGWRDHPPTNLLVKALIEGFSGKPSTSSSSPPAPSTTSDVGNLYEVQRRMGNRLPTVRGKISPKEPSFDVHEMRKRNAEALLRMSQKVASRG